MRVLAIDPGYDRLGVAVMDRDQKNGVLVYSACIETDRASDFSLRMESIASQVTDLFLAHQPSLLALERLYFNKNQRTAMKVAEVRGVMVYLAKLHACNIAEYTPQEIKVAVTGYGKSDKKQVADMVRRLVPAAKKEALDDEYDAIAIALTALAIAR